MSNLKKQLSWARGLAVVGMAGYAAISTSAVEHTAFEKPAAEHRPETWFHLIGGNVAKEGMDADLDAIKEAGIAGIQLFHGQCGKRFDWPGVKKQIPCLSEDWDDLIRYTAEGCEKRGLVFKMQNCPGWSMSGGPWIAPSNAMRKLVYSRTDVEAGKPFNGELPVPGNMHRDRKRDYKDLFVLAYPTPTDDSDRTFEPKAESDTDKDGVRRLVYRFPRPMKFRTMELPSIRAMTRTDFGGVRRSFMDRPGLTITVNGGKPHVVPMGCWQDNNTYTVALGDLPPSAVWTVEFKYRFPPAVKFLRFREGARLQDWEGKAGWALHGGMARDSQEGTPPECCIRGDAVIDITDKFKNGRLDWTPPAGGRWTVLRIGHVNMCTRNSPAPAEATGWECSKLDRAGIEAHFAGYLGRLAGGPLAGGKLKGFVVDSWECCCQTWTASLEDDFRAAHGYDFRRKIPAMFGWIIDSPAATDGFLRDVRQTLGDLVEKNYYGRMAELAREHGMTVQYETSFGDVVPGDIMAFWKHCDAPMCEFWRPHDEFGTGSDDFKPIRPCVSAANIYGKKRVAAEACTNVRLRWDEHLRMLKPEINNAYARGVTHLVFHTYTHNPQVGFLKPGTSFGCSIGTPFIRGQTWWPYMPEFTAWAARCETMLEAGRPANDILWYLGEAVDHKPSETSPFTCGYKYDYVNRDALLSRISVKGGLFTTPEGVAWKVLWVPVTKWMSPQVKAKLDALAKAGGRVCYGSPADVVTGIAPDVVVGPDAKGRVLGDWRRGEEQVEWIHRRDNVSDWYFVCPNLSDEYEGEVTFRAKGPAEIWDPATGSRRAADVTRRTGSTTTVRLSLASAESVFVVFPKEEGIGFNPVNPVNPVKTISATLREVNISGWKLSFPSGWGALASMKLDRLVSWHELPIGDEGRHFSGTATYVATFSAKAGEGVTLDLGRVETAATVYVNGKKVRALWSEPYRCDIDGSLVKDGVNELRIDVTSTWHNRLAYDAGLPEAERKTWTISAPGKNSPLQPSGLFGPVTLEADTRRMNYENKKTTKKGK